MNHAEMNRSKNEAYEYLGKIYFTDTATVKYLNYALALNRRSERYVKVKPTKKDGE
jgi:hypothetical protein